MILADFLSKHNFQCFTTLNHILLNINSENLVDSQLFFEHLFFKEYLVSLIKPTNRFIHEKLVKIVKELFSQFKLKKKVLYDFVIIVFILLRILFTVF